MDLLTRDELRALVAGARGPCVSLYLRARGTGAETPGDSPGPAKVLGQAVQYLAQQGQSAEAIDALLQPARCLLEKRCLLGKSGQPQSPGTAIFLAADFSQTYELCATVKELVVVGRRFHVKPLFAAITDQTPAAQLRHARMEASDQYLALWHTQRASNDLSDILPAALQGRVASLLVATDANAWGRLDLTTNEAVIGGTSIDGTPVDGDEDLLNLAAIHAYITGGAVYAVSPAEIPGGGNVAAVFRY